MLSQDERVGLPGGHLGMREMQEFEGDLAAGRSVNCVVNYTYTASGDLSPHLVATVERVPGCKAGWSIFAQRDAVKWQRM
jgi:hypothetical protein